MGDAHMPITKARRHQPPPPPVLVLLDPLSARILKQVLPKMGGPHPQQVWAGLSLLEGNGLPNQTCNPMQKKPQRQKMPGQDLRKVDVQTPPQVWEAEPWGEEGLLCSVPWVRVQVRTRMHQS